MVNTICKSWAECVLCLCYPKTAPHHTQIRTSSNEEAHVECIGYLSQCRKQIGRLSSNWLRSQHVESGPLLSWWNHAVLAMSTICSWADFFLPTAACGVTSEIHSCIPHICDCYIRVSSLWGLVCALQIISLYKINRKKSSISNNCN